MKDRGEVWGTDERARPRALSFSDKVARLRGKARGMVNIVAWMNDSGVLRSVVTASDCSVRWSSGSGIGRGRESRSCET